MRIFAWVCGIVAVLAAAAVAIVLLVDWNRYRGDVARLAGEAIGREVEIGQMVVDLGWTTRFHLRQIAVSNPEWASTEKFAEITDLKVAIRLWPLVLGDTNLPSLTLSGATINLERDRDGRATWQFNALGEASARALTPDEANEFPVVGALEITDSVVVLIDKRTDVALNAKISHAGGKAEKADGLEFEATGNLGGDSLAVTFSGGPIAILRAGDEPYPLDITAQFGPTEVTARGRVAAPFGKREADLRVSAKGPDLGAILPSLNLPLPHTPRYAMTARVVLVNDKWTSTALDGKVGETDIAGELSVDLSGKKPSVEGALVSRKLYFDDLAPVFGLGSGKTAPAKPDETIAAKPQQSGTPRKKTTGLFPEIPLDQARLETANVSLRYKAESIVSEILPLETIAARIALTDSLLVVDQIETGIADGMLAGRVELDARKSVPKTKLKVDFRGLGLKPFFAKSRFVEEMGGEFSGRIELRGTGNTIADTMAAAEGEMRIGMNGGSVSGLLIEAAGLDLAEALVLLVEDNRVPIRCGRIDADAEAGEVTLARVIVDTDDSTLLAGGKLDLKSEKLAIQIEARAKDFSLIDLAAPVRVYGAFTDPAIGIGGIDPLPFLEMGEQKNVDCAKLLQRAPSDNSE
mgnify:FL=1